MPKSWRVRVSRLVFWHKNRYGLCMQILMCVVFCLFSTAVYGIDSCQEFFSHDSVESIEILETMLLDGQRVPKWIVNYRNGVGVSVLKDMPFGRNPLFLSIEIFRTIFLLGGRVVKLWSPGAIENSPQMNCHGYSCLMSEIPGLPVGWLDGARINDSKDRKIRMQVLLDSFFLPVKTYTKETESMIASDKELREGDLIHYTDAEGNSVHSGLLIKRNFRRGDQFWVRSKIGSSLTVDLKVDKMSAIYDYVGIEIWRRNRQRF